jgi:beta-lactam-binding protein with PASTA domain
MPRRAFPSLVRFLAVLALACVAAPLHAQTRAAVPTMPDLIGLSQDQAIARLRALQMAAQVSAVPSAQPRGIVVSQSPGAGTAVRPGSSAVLEVSAGAAANDGQAGGTATQPSGGSGTDVGVRVRIPSQVTVPALTGMSLTMARLRLVAASLIPGGVDSATVPGARAGRIVSQSPEPGAVVRSGTRVRMIVASHASAQVPPVTPPPTKPAIELVAVPDVRGQTVSGARTAIGGARLLLGAVDSVAAGEVAGGTVIRQSPAAGDSVQPGTSVSIYVARAALVTVPSLARMTLADARRTLVEAGLRPGAVETKEAPGRPLIIGQSIAAGTAVPRNTVVGLTVSRAPVVVAPANPPVVATNPPAAPPSVATNPPVAPPVAVSPPAAPANPAAPGAPQNAPVSTGPAADRTTGGAGNRPPTQPVQPERATEDADLRYLLIFGTAILAVFALFVILGVRRLRKVRAAARAPRPAPAPAAPVAAPPVALRLSTSTGEGRMTSSAEKVANGRVKLNVRIADPRPADGDEAQAPLGPGRITLRTVADPEPRLFDGPETVATPARVRLKVDGDSPAFRAVDGDSVILKRR